MRLTHGGTTGKRYPSCNSQDGVFLILETPRFERNATRKEKRDDN